ncbi:hypothetical protein HK102_012683, partial [Quaeritorhiza haematococci]
MFAQRAFWATTTSTHLQRLIRPSLPSLSPLTLTTTNTSLSKIPTAFLSSTSKVCSDQSSSTPSKPSQPAKSGGSSDQQSPSSQKPTQQTQQPPQQPRQRAQHFMRGPSDANGAPRPLRGPFRSQQQEGGQRQGGAGVGIGGGSQPYNRDLAMELFQQRQNRLPASTESGTVEGSTPTTATGTPKPTRTLPFGVPSQRPGSTTATRQ